MGEIAPEFVLNRGILKECREQLMLSLEEVAKKPGLKHIQAIEEGKKSPTYNQLEKIAEQYQVPSWVFVSDELPEEYRYSAKPSFRKFKGSTVFSAPKIRKLVARVEDYRDFFIYLTQGLGEPTPTFSNPPEGVSGGIKQAALNVRRWLSMEPDTALDFFELKERLEKKSIFIFLTSKYKGWSHIEDDFRGLSIIDDSPVPIIIINGSDSKRAYSFTLMHELGHILRGDMGIDGEQAGSSRIEKWCDNFAGEFLMPSSSPLWASLPGNQLPDIKKLAEKFKVSPYACLVRLLQLGKISQGVYNARARQLQQEWETYKDRMKKAKDDGKGGGPARNRVREVRDQFGNTFVNTVLTTWRNNDLTLHKVGKIFDLKQAHQVIALDKSA